MKLVHVYRRDDGSYVLATSWRRTAPGCSDDFSYLGVYRWRPSDKAIERQLMETGNVVVSPAQFLANVGPQKQPLRLIHSSLAGPQQ